MFYYESRGQCLQCLTKEGEVLMLINNVFYSLKSFNPIPIYNYKFIQEIPPPKIPKISYTNVLKVTIRKKMFPNKYYYFQTFNDVIFKLKDLTYTMSDLRDTYISSFAIIYEIPMPTFPKIKYV